MESNEKEAVFSVNSHSFFEGIEKRLEIWFGNRQSSGLTIAAAENLPDSDYDDDDYDYRNNKSSQSATVAAAAAGAAAAAAAAASNTSNSGGGGGGQDGGGGHRSTSDGEEDEKAASSSDENDDAHPLSFLDEADQEQLALINYFKNLHNEDGLLYSSASAMVGANATAARVGSGVAGVGGSGGVAGSGVAGPASANSANNGGGDLRRIPRSVLESLLALVKCEIISSTKSEQIDSYVLSESSCFVSSTRIILKTCGTTQLLRCVKPLLLLARKYAGFDKVLDVFYSHKNFLRPELQAKVHTSFNLEFQVLDALFQGGSAYCFGRLNHDCWYFYTLNSSTLPDRLMGQPSLGTQTLGLNGTVASSLPTSGGATLEIIMQQLDPQKMAIFTKKQSASAEEATIKCGIDQIFADAVVDDFLFEPCGYSMNGLVNGTHYFTIHITPEPQCSFVSFETNVPQKNYQPLINKILRMFNPGKYSLVLFANPTLPSASTDAGAAFEYKTAQFETKDLQFCRFKHYDLSYGHFAKFPS